MSAAYYHLVVNHLPIFSILFGFLILLWGLIKKSYAIKNVAFLLLITGGISSYIALETGDGAEDILKEEPFFNHEMHERIEHHEHEAENAFWAAAITAVLSLVGLAGSQFSRNVQYAVDGIVVLFSAISLGLLVYTAYLGGGIRHTEAYSKEYSAVISNQHYKNSKTVGVVNFMDEA